ncbi:OLC1v1016038C1 [Oldenlandia corymbosa var. corymbosa]|uniref:OLC1v1016038C1 n=1 Tax=Oldenlandia corymbosa var. corymbosa TaxID=529605 RepID=A0AAV1E792_OLDCO|nr:OLC1v1016038C1 [Oldenlandia corymbosa var. corymbosa]
MAWNGPYFINVYWRNKYVEDGTIRTFDNRADATLVIERKLSYSEFLGRICDKAGWDRNYVNLRINLLFENNGVRRSATITDDSPVEIIYYFSGSSYLKLYVENEDTVHAQNLLDLSGQKQDVTFVSQQDQPYWMNNSQHAEAGLSRSSGDGYVAEGHGGGQNDDFDSSDEDDASDGTYVESEEEVDYQTDVSDETDLEDEEQEADAGAEAVQNLVTSGFGQHVYSDISDYKNSILDRDEFEVKMWKGDRENLDLNTCFNNRDEVEAAIEDWNIYHNRQFYVLSSGRKSWSAECATRRMQTPIGQSTCAWRMRASLKKNGLWQIVSWVDRHNSVGVTRHNDHRNLRSKLIARLIRRSVENDPGFKVKSIRDAVKEAYKVDVKYKKAWHARRKAIEACYGSWIDNFTELPWTGRGGNNWELHHREYIEKWNNRADSIVAGSSSAQSSTDDDYLPWYETNTIKFIKDPNKYNFQEEGYREHSDRAKFYADALGDICKKVEDYKKSEDVCQNSVCTNLLLELTSHSMSALSLGAHEMPILIPTQSLVDLQPQPSQPVGKVHK